MRVRFIRRTRGEWSDKKKKKETKKERKGRGEIGVEVCERQERYEGEKKTEKGGGYGG